jgi:hypothetical protein
MIDHLEEAADVALRFRHTCLAVSLKASIEAEAGGIGQAGSSLHRDLEKLQEVLKHFARGYFRRQNYFIYDYLVHRYWKGRITFSRVMALAKEYDRDVQNEDGFMELLMTNDCPDAHPIFEDHKDWQDSTMPKIGAVFELLEGATSDTDRMRGLTNELGLADTRKMRLQDYREQLAVQDLPADGNVVYFETEDEGLEGAA